jgi:hypothetical protein
MPDHTGSNELPSARVCFFSSSARDILASPPFFCLNIYSMHDVNHGIAVVSTRIHSGAIFVRRQKAALVSGVFPSTQTDADGHFIHYQIPMRDFFVFALLS